MLQIIFKRYLYHIINKVIVATSKFQILSKFCIIINSLENTKSNPLFLPVEKSTSCFPTLQTDLCCRCFPFSCFVYLTSPFNISPYLLPPGQHVCTIQWSVQSIPKVPSNMSHKSKNPNPPSQQYSRNQSDTSNILSNILMGPPWQQPINNHISLTVAAQLRNQFLYIHLQFHWTVLLVLFVPIIATIVPSRTYLSRIHLR